jgi:hypothetical protein
LLLWPLRLVTFSLLMTVLCFAGLIPPVLSNIIQTYQKASRQLVNYNKSEMVTSKGVSTTSKHDISKILPMPIKDQFTKYLGMLTVPSDPFFGSST